MTTTQAAFLLLLGLGFFFGIAFEEFYAQGGPARPGGAGIAWRIATQPLTPG